MTGTCVRTLDNFVDHLGHQLNDLESTELRRIAIKQGMTPSLSSEFDHVRWSEAFLTSVINDAFRLLHLERPDLFTSTHRFKLKPGCSIQPLPDGCSKFSGSLTNSTNCDSATVVGGMGASQIKTSLKLDGLFCSGSSTAKVSEYEVKSFGFDPKNPNQVVVTPPPPSGQDTWVTIGCVGAAPCYDWDEDKDEIVGDGFPVLDIYEILVIEYALYRAYGLDHEAESSKEVSKLHWDRSIQIVNEGKSSDYFFYHPDLFLMGPIDEGTGKNVFMQSK